MKKVIYAFDDKGNLTIDTEGYELPEGENGKKFVLSVDDAFNIMAATLYLMKENGIEIDDACSVVKSLIENAENGEEETFEVTGE